MKAYKCLETQISTTLCFSLHQACSHTMWHLNSRPTDWPSSGFQLPLNGLDFDLELSTANLAVDAEKLQNCSRQPVGQPNEQSQPHAEKNKS